MRTIGSVCVAATLLAASPAIAQQVTFPLRPAPSEIVFLTRSNMYNWYTESQAIGTTFDIMRGEPTDTSRVYRVFFFDADCATPQRYRQIATSFGTGMDEINGNMAYVGGGWMPATGSLPAAIRAKQFCLNTDLLQLAK